MIDVFTVAPATHLVEVRLLARSVNRHVEDSRFHWFVTGPMSQGLKARLDGDTTVAPLERFTGPTGPARARRGADAETKVETEIGTPQAALALLDQSDCAAVFMFSPQTVVFSHLPELVEDEVEWEILLTPMVVHPEEAQVLGLPNGELRALRHGVFSNSLVGVRRGEVGTQFLHWWAQRARDYVPPPDEHRSLRPWLNLAPALFPHVGVVRSPRCGVGRDNLHERRLVGDDEKGFEVDGEPLGFFDFTGHDDGSLAVAARAGRGDRHSLERLLHWHRESHGVDASEARAEPSHAPGRQP